jgi:hypothetical protein
MASIDNATNDIIIDTRIINSAFDGTDLGFFDSLFLQYCPVRFSIIVIYSMYAAQNGYSTAQSRSSEQLMNGGDQDVEF